MSESSNDDYSTLKENLLKMRLPVTGVRTFSEMLAKNFLNDFPLPWNRIFECILPGEEHLRDLGVNFESCFDKEPPFQLCESILTGSYSEGLFLYFNNQPDMDFLCVLKNITFTQDDQERGILSCREDTPYANAFITNKETAKLWNEFFHDAENRLSSMKLKKRLQENYQKSDGSIIFKQFGKEKLEKVTEGAAVTVSKTKSAPIRSFDDISRLEDCFFLGKIMKIPLSNDIVLSIFCEGWPLCAREWIKRERFWPDTNLVENIAQCGFHIVPKSSPDGDFRLSFSCAETKLIKTLLPLQHKVMRAFKAVVKFDQDSWSPILEGILSSYHLKTVAFWYFEKKSQESWSEEAAVHHLVTLLDELAEALRTRHLPMYFMPKVNLFQHFEDPVTLDLSERISKLSHNFAAMSVAVKNNLYFGKFSNLTTSQLETIRNATSYFLDFTEVFF